MCLGPLIWFEVAPDAALLECACCGYIIVTGNFHDEAHTGTPMLREGLAT